MREPAIDVGAPRLCQMLAVVALAALLVAPAAAQAHGQAPARTVPVEAGPYRLVVALFDDPPRTWRPLRLAVDPAPANARSSGRLQVTVTATPGRRINAAPTTVTLRPHADVAGGAAGELRLPVAGLWRLQLDVQGPLGGARADVPLQVAGPPAIPAWLAWTVGLLPLWALVVFVLVEAARAWRAGGLADP